MTNLNFQQLLRSKSALQVGGFYSNEGHQLDSYEIQLGTSRLGWSSDGETKNRAEKAESFAKRFFDENKTPNRREYHVEQELQERL